METTRIEKAVQILELEGRAYVIGQDGTLQLVAPGQILLPGTLLVTDENTRIVYDDNPELPAEAAQVPMDNDTLAEVDAIQAAILAGLDPTELFEAPAAGPAAGPVAAGVAGLGSGNGGFVVVDRVGGFVQPEAGFLTAFNPLAFETVDTLDLLLPADEPLPPNSIPTIVIIPQPPTDPEGQPQLPGVDGAFSWVSEAGLEGGSKAGNGQHATQGIIAINTGTDALAALEVLVQNKDGIWIDVTNGGVVEGLYGTLVINPDFTWTYTLNGPVDHPNEGQVFDLDVLSDVFQIRVTDDDGDSASASLDIFILDDGPLAEDDSATQVEENAPITVEVFANDKAGADGVDLASGVALVEGSLTGSGSLVYNNDGTFSYTPAAGEEDEVSFQYRLTDGDGDSATATVTITLQGDSKPTVSVLLAEGDDGVVWESALPVIGSGGGDLTASGSLDIKTGNDALDFIEVQDKDGNWIKIDADGTLVQGDYGTLSVNTDGSWTYTLAEHSLDHDGIDQTGGADQVQDQFQVRVTDDDGDVSPEAMLTVLINDDGPVAEDDSASQANENEPVTIDVFANDKAGADGVDLASGVALVEGSLTGSGSLVYNNDGTFSYTPAAGEEGEVSFQYRLTDGDGDSATATVTITLQGDSKPTVSVLLAEGDDGVVWESALPAGSGGGDLTASGSLDIKTGNDALDFIEVQDKDGNWIKIDADGTLVQGDYGTLSVNTDGSWTYTLAEHSLDHDGIDQTGGADQVQDQFQVRVTDDDGDVSPEAMLTIQVNDDGPVAEDDSASQANENEPVTIDVFANDKAGADGVDLASGVALVEGSLTGSGSLVYNNDGTFSYTPAAGEEGEVSFQYRLTDGDGDSATATVTITLQGDSKPTVSVLLAEGDDGVVWESALPAGSGGGDLTASGSLDIKTGNDALDFIEVQDKDGNWIKIDADGTLVQGDYGTLSVNTDGSWTYTLAEHTLDHDGIDQTGGADQVQDQFQVRVTDDDGDVSPEAMLTVLINDDGPVAEDDSATQVEENAPITVEVFANDKAGADGVDLASGVALVEGSLTGSGSLVYNNDGTFSYTPAAGEEDEVSFQYRLTDGDGDSATATVTITLQGDSKPTVSVLLAEGDDGVVWESALPVIGSGGGDLTASGSLDIKTGNDALDFIEVQDKDGNWIKIDADGTLVQGDYGTLSVNTDGSWTYTLAEHSLDHDGIDQTGGADQVQDQFQVRVTDDDGDVSPEAMLTVLINDDGPVAEDDSASQANENEPVTIDVFANDKAGADGVDLASGVALVEGSLTGSGSLVYNNDGTFSYTPAAGEEGEVSFQYRLTDGDGDSATATVTITLQGDSKPTVSVLLAEGDDGVVWESALPAGSGGGDLTASGSLDIKTGNDALDFIEVQDKDGNWIKIDADGTLVQGDYGTLSVNTDGSWTYTLAEHSLDHDGIDQTGGADQVQDQFQVRVTDDDGDVSPEAMLTIQVNDDGPVAEDDSASQANENEPVTIDVFANDKAGADGVDLASGVALVEGSLTGSGSLVYNNDGTFSYTPAAGEEGEVSFQYRLTDGDGDSATATVTITLQGDSKPTVSVLLAEGDDGVVWESALPAGSGGGDLTASGSLDIKTGNDALDFIEVQDKDGNWIKIDADGTLVQGDYGTLSVNTDGSWTYTLDTNSLEHDDPNAIGTADQVQDQFQVRVTDDDDDVSPEATLTVLINDDGPVAEDESPQLVVEDDAGQNLVAGNVLDNDSFGADGQAAGTYLVWNEDNAEVIEALSQYGTLVLNDDGSYQFTLDNSLAAVQALTAEDELSFTLGYTIYDGDGDPDGASLTILIQGADDDAEVTILAGEDERTVYEAGLVSEQDERESVSGTVQISASDGIASVTIGGVLFTLAALQAFSEEAPGEVATQYGTLYLTGFDENGILNYTYVLGEAQEHVKPGNDETLSENVEIEVAGIGGTQASGTLTLHVVDDVPTLSVMNLSIANIQATYQGFYQFNMGADVHGFASAFDASALVWQGMPDGYSFTLDTDLSGDEQLLYKAEFFDGQQTQVFFTIAINSDGTYDFNLVTPEPISEVDSGNLLQGVNDPSGSKYDEYIFDNSVFNEKFDVKLTAYSKGTQTQVFVSSGSLGVDGGTIQNTGNNDEMVRFDIVPTGGVEDVRLSNFSIFLSKEGNFSGNTEVELKLYYINGDPVSVISKGTLTADGTQWQLNFEIDPTRELDYVELSPFSNNTTLKVEGVSLNYVTSVFPDDYQLDFVLTGADADQDMDASEFSVSVSTTTSNGYEITGTDGDDVVYGTDGNDILIGGAGDDILIGGLGNNTLTGGDGADIFRFIEADAGSVNTITDFEKGIDQLDLSELLNGEESGNLNDYLNFSLDNGDTLLTVSPGGDGGNTQVIRFENQDLLADYGVNSSSALINAMLDDQSLMVDKS
ncbi:retention module-containing protein [Zobellella denitrificans]